MTSSKSVEVGSWWKRSGELITWSTPGVKCVAGPNLFVVQASEMCALVSRDHLTLLSDLSSPRFSIKLQAKLNDSLGFLDYRTTEELEIFIKNGECMLSLAGNDAYDLVYTLEPSCITRLAGDYKGTAWQCSDYRLCMEKEMNDKADKLGLQQLLTEREDLLTKIFNRNINAFAQLYGLYRIWGHPTLEPLLGTIALRAKAQTGRYYLRDQSEAITNKFKEDFILRYITRHKEWPQLNIDRLPPFHPLRVHYERKLPFPLTDSHYKRDHLSLVSFQKIFPVDTKFDLIEFIDDKALSLGLPELLEEITKRKNIGSSLSRSLLLKFLQSNISDPEQFLNNINESGFPLDEVCVGLHEKEREGKLKARLFGILTYIKRSYVVLTEKILADHVFPYFPEVTMVDDELSLEKKTHGIYKT